MANDKSGRKKLLKGIITIVILVIATMLGVDITTTPTEEASNQNQQNIVTQNVDGELMLHMIDVGQADSFLLIQGNETALIDCGTRSTGKDVVNYLNNIGITKLDYVFGTHPHDDHMGGMYDVITNFEVGKVIIPEAKNAQITSTWYANLMKSPATNVSSANVTILKQIQDI